MGQLQSQNLFFDLQKDICKILNDVPELSAIDFLPANNKDIETEITKALRSQGVCGIVVVNEASFQGFESGINSVWQVEELIVQIIENPVTNRASNNTNFIGTAEDIGAKVSQVLGSPEYGHWSEFNLKKIEIGEESNLLTAKVTFQCLVQTNISSYVPPEHPDHRIPFADTEWVQNNFASLSSVYNKTQIDDIIKNVLQEVNEEIRNTKESIPTKTSQLSNDSGFIDSKSLSSYAKISYVDSKDNEIKGNIKNISDVIPNQATPSNQLADKAFVNSSINNYAAFYLTKNANGDAFQTYGEMLLADKYWNAGVERIPTKNDYLVVLKDETKTTTLGVDPTTRYVYQGEWPTGQFEFQYIVNNTALTQAQVDAINSGITKDDVDKLVVPSPQQPGWAQNSLYSFIATKANNASNADFATMATMAEEANSVKYYSETLLSGLTEDDIPVSFYILTKN